MELINPVKNQNAPNTFGSKKKIEPVRLTIAKRIKIGR